MSNKARNQIMEAWINGGPRRRAEVQVYYFKILRQAVLEALEERFQRWLMDSIMPVTLVGFLRSERDRGVRIPEYLEP